MTEPLRLRVLVTDDERPARAKARRFVAADPHVGPIHESWDAASTRHVLRDTPPDIMFLDISMPGTSGLELLSSLAPEAAPVVVFVTAHDGFALDAFDLSAVDYLLKPFDGERFARAMRRAVDAVLARRAAEDLAHAERLMLRQTGAARPYLDRMLVGLDERKALVATDDIERLEAERNYVRVCASHGTFMIRATLSELEDRLDPGRFARIGKAMIVNLDRVVHAEATRHGDYVLKLGSGSRARLSRRYVDRVGGRFG